MGNLQDDHFPDMTHAMGHQSKHITMHLYIHMIQRQDDFPFYQPAFTTKYSPTSAKPTTMVGKSFRFIMSTHKQAHVNLTS